MLWSQKRTGIEKMNGKGVVISIHIAPTGAAPMKSVAEVRALAGKGLEGDRYFNKLGTYSNQPGSGRDITLIEGEAGEALQRDYQIELDAGVFRSNIVTRALPHNHRVGQEFRGGEAV